jgi:hypothetical protein
LFRKERTETARKDQRKEERLTGVKTQDRVYRKCNALIRSGCYMYPCFNVIALKSVNRIIFVAEKEFVSCEVGTNF